MLNNKGFDLWADGYDRSVGLCEENGEYPFAGYRAVLGGIYARIMRRERARVLDIGFGTATLTAKLYANGCTIYGQDFSQRMLEIAREKMPVATLVCADFAQGLAPELARESYDFIVSTYALHHLSDAQKRVFIGQLLPLLRDGGLLLVGDVAFASRSALEECRRRAGEGWDEDEVYFVAEEMERWFPGQVAFTPCSHCAGILCWKKEEGANGTGKERADR